MTLVAGPGARSLGVLLVLIVALGIARPAQAARVSATDSGFVYTAALGETNTVSVHLDYDPETGATTVTVVDTGAAIVPGSGCSSTGPDQATCEVSDYLDEAIIRLRDGNDVFAGSGYGGAEFCAVDVFGGTGADTLVGGPIHDCLDGGDDADRLEGRGGLDSLYGGEGNDVLLGGAGKDLLYGQGGADRMEGGGGHDLVEYTGSHEGVRVTLDGRRNDGHGRDLIASDVEGAVGSPKADVLIGNDQRNSLWGYDGDDVVRGRAGNDYLVGGWGDDDVGGGPGNDLLLGAAVYHRETYEIGCACRDRIGGGAGDDRLIAFDYEPDRLVDGGPGRDRANIDPGIDPTRAIEILRTSYTFPPYPPAYPSHWWQGPG